MVCKKRGYIMFNNKHTTIQKSVLERFKNRDWLDASFKEVQGRYSEKWIAVAGKKVVASGNDPDIVINDVKGKFPALEIVVVLVPPGEISQPI